MGKFQDQVVIVTGAGAGIGKAAALAFAREGALVVVNSLSAKNTAATVEKIRALGGRTAGICGDVAEEAVAKAVVETAVKEFGRVDVLVNNAGITTQGTIDTLDVETWDKTMSVNVRSVFLMSKYTVVQMRANGGGVIVNTASVAGIKGVANRAVYSATKGAVLALTRAIAADCIHDNIRVNSVSPGTVLSPSLEARIGEAKDPVAEKARYVARQPLGRLGTAEEAAAAILFAASPENSFMTGSNIVTDGGATL